MKIIKGFTLIELLVVIAIIGILSSVVLASLQDARQKSGLSSESNYKISHDGRSHFVESYTKESGGTCVYLSEKELRLCGDFSIERLN